MVESATSVISNKTHIYRLTGLFGKKVVLLLYPGVQKIPHALF